MIDPRIISDHSVVIHTYGRYKNAELIFLARLSLRVLEVIIFFPINFTGCWKVGKDMCLSVYKGREGEGYGGKKRMLDGRKGYVL